MTLDRASGSQGSSSPREDGAPALVFLTFGTDFEGAVWGPRVSGFSFAVPGLGAGVYAYELEETSKIPAIPREMKRCALETSALPQGPLAWSLVPFDVSSSEAGSNSLRQDLIRCK